MIASASFESDETTLLPRTDYLGIIVVFALRLFLFREYTFEKSALFLDRSSKLDTRYSRAR